MQPALQAEQRSCLHAFARNVFQIEISAFGAMGKPLKGGRYAPGIIPVIAGVASPRAQADCREGPIQHAVAMRLKTIGAAASRTNHRVKLLLFSPAAYLKLSRRASLSDSVPRRWACRIASERNPYARLYRRARARGNCRKVPRSGNLPEYFP